MGNERIYGEHDGGFVAALYLFEKDGKIATDLVAIPYSGKSPTKEMIDARAKEDTHCQTAEAPAAVNVHLVFSELNHTCPNAKHAGE